MISDVSDYLLVTGADVDADHPHGDLDRIVIDGGIMPCRTGYSTTTGVELKRQLRGEDVAFLGEVVAEMDRSYTSVTAPSGTTIAKTVETPIVFSRKLQGGVASPQVLAWTQLAQFYSGYYNNMNLTTAELGGSFVDLSDGTGGWRDRLIAARPGLVLSQTDMASWRPGVPFTDRLELEPWTDTFDDVERFTHVLEQLPLGFSVASPTVQEVTFAGGHDPEGHDIPTASGLGYYAKDTQDTEEPYADGAVSCFSAGAASEALYTMARNAVYGANLNGASVWAYGYANIAYYINGVPQRQATKRFLVRLATASDAPAVHAGPDLVRTIAAGVNEHLVTAAELLAAYAPYAGPSAYSFDVVLTNLILEYPRHERHTW